MIKADRVPASVYGVNNGLALSLRRTAAACAPPRCKRRDLNVALALHDVEIMAEVSPPLIR